MQLKYLIHLTLLCFFFFKDAEGQPKPKYKDSFGIAFWNLENYCDTIDDFYGDDEFTPAGKRNWNSEKFNNKIQKLSQVIDELNVTILGVCEVEKKENLELLAKTSSLEKYNFAVVCDSSPDERGMDVGVLYNQSIFQLKSKKAITVKLPNGDKTRDILWVKFLSKVDSSLSLNVMICHFPSRRDGAKESEAKRIIAAKTLRNWIDSLRLWQQNLIVMGDFNDNPWDTAIRHIANVQSDIPVQSSGFRQPKVLENCWSKKHVEIGSIRSARGWDKFDQIWFSKPPHLAIKGKSVMKVKPSTFSVFKPDYLLQKEGKYQGYPLRTFGGSVYLNGYSDHLPVRVNIEITKF